MVNEPEGEDGAAMQARVDRVFEQVEAACRRAGRSPGAVRVIAVAKTYGPEVVSEAFRCGLETMGENRVQEARQKIPLCPSGCTWHLIGHLQRNKVREAVRLFAMIHSVDSLRLLESIEQAADEAGLAVPVCLQVNVSGESSKYGFAPAAVPEALAVAAGMRRAEVAGLMTIPPFHPDPEASRASFRCLREWRDTWAAESGFPLTELSMGMSGDFEVAIEEGATMIRVGAALFGPRQPRSAKREDETCA